jgi:PAS domain S-box-containing protein
MREYHDSIGAIEILPSNADTRRDMSEPHHGLASAALDDAAVRVLASHLNLVADLFDALDEGIALYRRDGTVVTGNATSRRWVGRAPGELRDAFFAVHIAPEALSEAAAMQRHVLESGENVAFATTFIHADGTRIPVDVKLIPARYQGAIVGVYGIARLREAQAF